MYYDLEQVIGYGGSSSTLRKEEAFLAAEIHKKLMHVLDQHLD